MTRWLQVARWTVGDMTACAWWTRARLVALGARHSQRVPGAADNLILGRKKPAKCPVSRNAKCEMSSFAKCEMRNVQFREMRNAKFRAISQGQIDVPKWNRAAGGAKLPGEVRSSVDAPSTPRLPTTSGHASSWQQRAEAAAKQEQQDFLAAFSDRLLSAAIRESGVSSTTSR